MSKIKEFDLYNNEKSSRYFFTLDELTDIYLYISTAVNGEVYLKGNVLLNNILGDIARGTVDIDLSIYDTELYEVVRDKLYELCSELIAAGIITEFKLSDTASDGKSGGVKMYKDGEYVSGVDVSIHSTSSRLGVCKYYFNSHEIEGSTIDRILCDKVLATLSPKRFRRAKDFYDIYIILSSGLEFNDRIIFDLMVDKVGIDKVRELFNYYPYEEDTILKLMTAWKSLVIENFTKSPVASKPDFTEMMYHISRLFKTLKSIVEGGN